MISKDLKKNYKTKQTIMKINIHSYITFPTTPSRVAVLGTKFQNEIPACRTKEIKWKTTNPYITFVCVIYTEEFLRVALGISCTVCCSQKKFKS